MMRKFFAVFVFVFVAATSALARDLPDFTELYEKQGPAVVNISTTQTIHSERQGFMPFPNVPEDDPFYEFFRRFAPPGGGQGQDYQTQSLGSGFIISADGYILTNAHVVNNADEVLVKLADKREFKAKIIGIDRRTDVALLKIDGNGLPRVTFGDPSQLRVGEWVAAIGSPFGLENTVTAGIVSAKGRALPQENYVPFIQTDVAINPGNSGGPLFNLKGEVVGINSQIFSRSGGYMGLSFAIPIDVALDVQNQLKANGKVTRGWMGINIQEISHELADSFGMKNTNGALVVGVEKGSPAEKAGVQTGDVILKFDGKAVNTSSDLPRIVAATKPNTVVDVDVLRKGNAKTLTLTVGEMPSDDKETVRPDKDPAKVAPNKLGLALRELTPQQKKRLNGKNGLLVIGSEGASAQAGIMRGDVILAVNNSEVQSVEQFNKLIAPVQAGKTVALLVMRGDSTLYVPVKLSGK
ncbi:MAG: DegQ family serine endoprotease [Methylobacillus sp.]|nr:DegQ family serine endoprotease [Methylobacillus sp.]